MSIIYVAGSTPGVGKTSLATAISRLLLSDGKSVALIKPLVVSSTASLPPILDQEMAYYSQIVPGNPAFSTRILNPEDNLSTQESTLQATIDAIKKTARLCDTLVIEGLDGLDVSNRSTEVSKAIVEELHAQAVVLTNYDSTLETEAENQPYTAFGQNQVGAIINRVPRYQKNKMAAKVALSKTSTNIHIIGSIPEDRLMLSPTVQQLGTYLDGIPLHGEYLHNPAERTEEIVQYIMVGGWFLDQGAYVFSRRPDKAVIVRGDRPDAQMAALETHTMCLILTDGRHPVQYITYQAEQHQVPMYLVEASTTKALEAVQGVSSQVNAYNTRKTDRFLQLLTDNCDLSGIR